MSSSLRAFLLAVAPLTIAFAVVLGVNLLPPDTALDDIQAAGRLTVCAPREMGPLVTRDQDRPGFEIALVEEAARRAGWRIAITSSVAMAREFNPGNWRISRANCRLMVGGLRDNAWSRSLMEMGQPYLTSSWVWVAPPGTDWPPARAVFHPGVFALDRVGLSTFLRQQSVPVMPVQGPAALLEAMAADPGTAAITDSITANFLFGASDLDIAPLPGGPAPTGISLGFWKGDTTLRRHMDDILAGMQRDGTIARLAEDYELGPAL